MKIVILFFQYDILVEDMQDQMERTKEALSHCDKLTQDRKDLQVCYSKVEKNMLKFNLLK